MKMKRIRAFYDADRENRSAGPTAHPTGENKNLLVCSECGADFFVSDQVLAEIKRIFGETGENPFLCAECIAEYEEEAVSPHAGS